ncbi:MAG: hypothetical protein KDA41_13410 [Planctomycetales bacterium]|nr:hypothetical protein [Planctomycetales bacterium]
MAKFYVQSGTLKVVVHAAEADRAVLWAAHQVLAQVLPVFDDAELSAHEKQAVATLQGLLVLDAEIRVSERGFDREDALVFDTADVVTEWSQLVIAISKIDALAAEERDAESPALCAAL